MCVCVVCPHTHKDHVCHQCRARDEGGGREGGTEAGEGGGQMGGAMKYSTLLNKKSPPRRKQDGGLERQRGPERLVEPTRRPMKTRQHLLPAPLTLPFSRTSQT